MNQPADSNRDSLPTAGSAPDDLLPAVEAPTGTFILQLFLIPLLIVSMVIALWMLFNWLASTGREGPKEIVAQLRRDDDIRSHRAFELADLLRSSDPRSKALRRNPQFALDVASVLLEDLEQPLRSSAASGKTDDAELQRSKRRMFLCRALGGFEIPEPIPALLVAAKHEQRLSDVQVRLSALEALSALAGNLGAEKLRSQNGLVAEITEISRSSSENDPPAVAIAGAAGPPPTYRPHAELRAVAAYTLGVIGGPEALQRLAVMLDDPYANARYNAATGLARAGDDRAIPVLKEMLDPENEQADRDERDPRDQAHKRTAVLLAGIQASTLWAQKKSSADRVWLYAALERLGADLPTRITHEPARLKSAALEAVRRLRQSQP